MSATSTRADVGEYALARLRVAVPDYPWRVSAPGEPNPWICAQRDPDLLVVWADTPDEGWVLAVAMRPSIWAGPGLDGKLDELAELARQGPPTAKVAGK